MPFGLKNAGAAYCALASALEIEVNSPHASSYLDDNLCHTQTFDEHVEVLRKMFKAHAKLGILLNPSKTCLFRPHVEFLGFRVSEGVRIEHYG